MSSLSNPLAIKAFRLGALICAIVLVAVVENTDVQKWRWEHAIQRNLKPGMTIQAVRGYLSSRGITCQTVPFDELVISPTESGTRFDGQMLACSFTPVSMDSAPIISYFAFSRGRLAAD